MTTNFIVLKLALVFILSWKLNIAFSMHFPIFKFSPIVQFLSYLHLPFDPDPKIIDFAHVTITIAQVNDTFTPHFPIPKAYFVGCIVIYFNCRIFESKLIYQFEYLIEIIKRVKYHPKAEAIVVHFARAFPLYLRHLSLFQMSL